MKKSFAQTLFRKAQPLLLSVCLCLSHSATGEMVQEATLRQQFPSESAAFGACVACSGDTVVVGAPNESSGSRGVNGNEQDRSKPNSGAVFVFVRQGGKWMKQAYLKASNADPLDSFGSKVAIDRDTIAVLASGEGSAALGINGNQNDNSLRSGGGIKGPAMAPRGAIYIFTRQNGVWTQQAYIKPPDAQTFLSNVSLSGDFMVTGRGNILVRREGVWSFHSALQPVPPSDFTANVGSTSIISGETIVAVGFEALASRPKTNKITESKYLPTRAGYVFVKKGEAWVQETRFTLPGKMSLGANLACAPSQDSIAFGLPGVHLTNDLKLIEDNEGLLAKVTEPHYRGEVLVFHREADGWKQSATLTGRLMPANSNAGAFGTSLALEGDRLAVGDPLDNSQDDTGTGSLSTSNTGQFSGAIHGFKITEGHWSRTDYLRPQHSVNAGQGSSVALSGSLLVSSAPREGYDPLSADGSSSRQKSKNEKRSPLTQVIRFAGAVYILRSSDPGAAAK
jgi:hypothetical protein